MKYYIYFDEKLKKVQFRMNMPLFLALWVQQCFVDFFSKRSEILVNINEKVKSLDYLLSHSDSEATVWNNSDNKVSIIIFDVLYNRYTIYIIDCFRVLSNKIH